MVLLLKTAGKPPPPQKKLTLRSFVLQLVVRVHTQHDQVSCNVINSCVLLNEKKRDKQNDTDQWKKNDFLNTDLAVVMEFALKKTKQQQPKSSLQMLYGSVFLCSPLRN